MRPLIKIRLGIAEAQVRLYQVLSSEEPSPEAKRRAQHILDEIVLLEKELRIGAAP